MSSVATSWAWDEDIEQNEKLLLLFVADNADRNGFGRNLSELLKDAEYVCGMDKQTVNKHIASLERSKRIILKSDHDYQLNIGKDRRPRLGPFRIDIWG